MSKVKVNAATAKALDALKKDEESIQYHLIRHCKSFSGNGICMKSNYEGEMDVLTRMQPLTFAKCLLKGYEVAETETPLNK